MRKLEGWEQVLGQEEQKEYFKNLIAFLKKSEQGGKAVFPPKEQRLAALESVSFNNVKVVIVGQDPYHREGQAHGLSFSVLEGVKPPPSLVNIFKEVQRDVGITNHSGSLKSWAKQGVLLLNRSLTVEKQKPGSHSGIGWESFTSVIIESLIKKRSGLIFVAWGRVAENFLKTHNPEEHGHHLLVAAHPSPFSYKKFKGCGHFSQINGILQLRGEKEINWSTDVNKN